ncbi:MAG: hypothetical protein ACK6A5_18845, partial [Flavobacteriales bacterium]
RLARGAAELYAASGSFTVLHLLTSAHALRVLLPVLDDPLPAVQAYWRGFAAAWAASGARDLGPVPLQPWARIVSSAVVGVEPRIMGIGPVNATKRALERAGLTLADMDILELNEAFAAQVLSCTRSLGLSDNDPRINPNGGAIALGHPLGMRGARLLQTAALELKATGKRYALCTMCIGVGQGYATIIERC